MTETQAAANARAAEAAAGRDGKSDQEPPTAARGPGPAHRRARRPAGRLGPPVAG